MRETGTVRGARESGRTVAGGAAALARVAVVGGGGGHHGEQRDDQHGWLCGWWWRWLLVVDIFRRAVDNTNRRVRRSVALGLRYARSNAE